MMVFGNILDANVNDGNLENLKCYCPELRRKNLQLLNFDERNSKKLILTNCFGFTYYLTKLKAAI